MNRRLGHGVSILCALLLATLAASQAMAARRVALVVGNGNYEHAATLANPPNDANAIAALLTRAGFEVVDERRDVGVVEFKRAVREFTSAAANADIAVVYYSGHGIEIGGVNYLVPVDAKLVNDADVEDEAISLDRIIGSTQSAKLLSLIILDACRNSPFARHPGARLAPPAAVAIPLPPATRSMGNPLAGAEQPGANTLVAYAAKAGSVSFDGTGANSPFTTALLKYIAEPGLDIRIALGKVRDDVLASTSNRQEPFVYGSLGGAGIALVPAPEAPTASSAAAVSDPNAGVAADYEMAERVGTPWAWVAFLAAHNGGFYANLARAQLEKLVPASANGAPPPLSAEPSKAPPLASVASQTPSDVVAAKDQRQAALPISNPVAANPDCKADELKLKQLRLDPDLEQVSKFSRDLTCEKLRHELNRLMESIGADPRVEPAAQTLKGEDLASACKHESAELMLLRANPDKTSATKFAHDLKCDNLRPQVVRLLESIGN
ncbi:MAG: caspase family protein [Roseiarcus sp.]